MVTRRPVDARVGLPKGTRVLLVGTDLSLLAGWGLYLAVITDTSGWSDPLKTTVGIFVLIEAVHVFTYYRWLGWLVRLGGRRGLAGYVAVLKYAASCVLIGFGVYFLSGTFVIEVIWTLLIMQIALGLAGLVLQIMMMVLIRRAQARA
jgi:hypothetical protein